MDLLAWGLTFALASSAADSGASADPQAAPTVLTLDAAMARAREQSPMAAATRARADGARQAADQTPRWLNPSIELRAENWGSSHDLPLDGFILLNQPLEISGSRGSRVGLAAAEGAEAASRAREVEVEVARDTGRRYLEAVRAREGLAFVRELRDGLQDIVTALERRVAEGVAAEADLGKFQTELAQADTERLRLELELSRTLGELAVRLSLPDLSADQLALPALPTPAAPVDDQAIEAAVERRADIAMARARVERAARAVALERARGRPDLLLSGGYKRTAEADTGVLAVLLPIPLTDRNRAATARAEAEARAAALELQGLRAFAKTEARTLVTRARVLAERAGHGQSWLVAPATLVRSAARASFREGAFDALRIVDAERAWTEARRAALALHLDAVLAAIEARLAQGQEVWP